MEDEEYDEEGERAAQVRSTLLIVLGVLVALGVVVAVGTSLMVRSLGLDEDPTSPVGSGPAQRQPLPTTALPVPGETDTPSDEPTELVTPDEGKRGAIQLNVSPVMARPMERVNLTGTYQGADNQQLKVQRFEDGTWRDFGVSATVRVGTYETYIMTGRSGENRFRVYDDQARKGSNVVLVTID